MGDCCSSVKIANIKCIKPQNAINMSRMSSQGGATREYILTDIEILKFSIQIFISRFKLSKKI
jgi:hypothetical protein